ncbi:MAG TPA: hypothetical protein PKM27_11320 [Saprospiraceae bacterium]|nr:hypothetical protein [Saprospiraceae bacterium]HNT20299.1 hypothetical protein [Saprospiraceae bacterium]
MSIRQFYIQLAFITGLTGMTLYFLTRYSGFESGWFPLVGLIFFFLFSILIFHLGLHSAGHQDKNRFTGVVMGMIFLKLVLTLGIVLVYDKMIAPLGIQHVLSFLIAYLFFTFFEVYFMSKLARRRPA